MSKDERDGRRPETVSGSAEARPRRVVSLLGQSSGRDGAPPPEAPAHHQGDQGPEERPGRGASGGGPDPLRSTHSAFRDLEAPRGDPDPAKARAICAEIARDALRDFAPALILLGVDRRLRAQAAIAYARTLLDFARDRSLEGERLAQINRFEFALEAALGGEPQGQPVFVQLAAQERRAPWPREAFDALAAIARSRISVGLPATEHGAAAQRRRLAGAALHTLLGVAPVPELEALGATILRAASLLAWHDALWFHRPDLGLDQHDAASPRWREVVKAEAGAIRVALAESSIASASLPADLRRAGRYARHAATEIARRAARYPDTPSPPRLSAGRRVALLMRSISGA